jgi:6-phosphogluconolactonase
VPQPAVEVIAVFGPTGSGKTAVAEAVADLVMESLRGGARSLVLAGGTTPQHAYRLLRPGPEWSRVAVLFGDERCVAPDDAESNYAAAAADLLGRVHPASVHRMPGELGPDEAARCYEGIVRAYSPLDLVLLGMGPDGHTASLFPESPALGELRRRVVAGPPGLPPYVDRVTLTIPALRDASRIVYLVTGREKSDVAARAFAGLPDPQTPASLVRSDRGGTIAILDRAATASL